jgi:hypothetical protein
MLPTLPQEIIDKILLLSDVRCSIAVGNEHVKQQLLPKLHLPKRWQSQETEIVQWLVKYNISGRLQAEQEERLRKMYENYSFTLPMSFTEFKKCWDEAARDFGLVL